MTQIEVSPRHQGCYFLKMLWGAAVFQRNCGCLISLQLRQSLDALLNDMKNLPARLKQYSSFEYVQKTIKTYLKVIVSLL